MTLDEQRKIYLYPSIAKKRQKKTTLEETKSFSAQGLRPLAAAAPTPLRPHLHQLLVRHAPVLRHLNEGVRQLRLHHVSHRTNPLLEGSRSG